MASVTITIPNSNWQVLTGPQNIAWLPPTGSYISLGDALSTDGNTTLYLGALSFGYSSGLTAVQLASSQTQNDFNAGPDFSNQMEQNGTITLTASDGSSITLTGISDSSEPYSWTPSNSVAVAAFANTLRTLADRSLTVTFNDNSNAPPVISNLVANPMSVANGGDVALTVDVTDPNMDMLTYVWTASPNVGTFADPTAQDTIWTAHAPLVETPVTLTLTVDDGTETSTASVMVTVQGTPRAPNASPYRVLVDINNNDTYLADIYNDVSALSFEAGASGARRLRITAARGELQCRVNNSAGVYSVSDFENKPIRVRRNGLYLWGGTIDDVEEVPGKGLRRDISITALGNLTAIGGAVVADLSESGDIPASEAVEMLTGLTDIEPSTQEVSDWSVSAGDDILQELRKIQDSSGTRIYEDGEGNIQLAGQGVAELLDITIADSEPQAGDKHSRRFKRDKPKSGIINAAVIDGAKYTDSDSVDAYGEILHPSDFEFAVGAQAATIAANLFSLYAEPSNLYNVSFLLEELAGTTNQDEILRLLHYGNERVLKVRFEGEIQIVEIIKVGHSLFRGERHIIDLQLRQRDTAEISLNLCTYYNQQVHYFAQLPPENAAGTLPITGHKIQYREAGTQAWTDVVSSETGLVVNDSFTVPDDNEYEVRLVATSAGGDEQTTATQTLKAFAPRGFSNGGTGTGTARGLWLHSDQIRNHQVVDDGIFGFDVQVRGVDVPEGLNGFPQLYETRTIFAEARYNAFVQSGNVNSAGNTYAITYPQYLTLFNIATAKRLNQASAIPFRARDTGVAPFTTPFDSDIRVRPVFWDAAIADGTRASFNAAERGIWTPWIRYDGSDIGDTS